MKKISGETISYIVLGVVVLVFLCIIGFSWGPKTSSGEDLYSLGIMGVCEFQDGSTFDLTDQDGWSQKKADLGDVIIRGHFDHDVQPGDDLMLYLERTSAVLSVNGEVLLQTAEEEWTIIRTDGISKSDDITLRLTRTDHWQNSIRFEKILHHIYGGNRAELLSQQIRKSAVSITISLFLMIFGLVMTVALCALRFAHMPVHSGDLACALLMLVGGACTFIDYRYITLLVGNPHAVHAVDELFQMGIVFFMLIYFREFLTDAKDQRILTTFIGIWEGAIIFYCLVNVLQVTWRNALMNVFLLIGGAILICSMGMLIRHSLAEKKDASVRNVIYSGIILYICTMAEMVHRYITTSFWIALFQIGLLIFAVVQASSILTRTDKRMEKARKADEIEKELANNRISMLISQMQPHFIYNVLVVIKQLIDKNPEMAKETISEFSTYLRGNMDSLNEVHNILFTEELRHVKNYISLEKKRFGDRIQVEYDIAVEDFTLPALSVQPIVENAIRHGITKKEDGGTIWISTRREDGCIVIVIRDDGVGKTAVLQTNGVGTNTRSQTNGVGSNAYPQVERRSHIGVMNVRERIENMCGGTLTMESVENVGTTVTIRIPEEKR